MAFPVILTVFGRCQVWRKNKSLVTRGIRSLLARQRTRGQRGQRGKAAQGEGYYGDSDQSNVPHSLFLLMFANRRPVSLQAT